MFRDCAKSALCGVIVLFASGCQETRSLVANNCGSHEGVNFVKVSASNPKIEYQIKRNLSYMLSKFSVIEERQYKILVDVTKESGIAAFSEKEVVKKHIRLIASVQIIDKNHNIILNKKVDTYSTYEVNDIAPFASVSSKEVTIEVLIKDLSRAVANLVATFL